MKMPNVSCFNCKWRSSTPHYRRAGRKQFYCHLKYLPLGYGQDKGCSKGERAQNDGNDDKSINERT